MAPEQQQQLPPEATDEDVREALAFVQSFDVAFGSETDSFRYFFDLVGDLCKGIVGVDAVVRHADELLGGHPALLEWFRVFLPGVRKSAVDFMKRVRDVASVDATARLIMVVGSANADKSMSANVIYDLAGEALGPANRQLLREFGARFLPGIGEWHAQQRRAAANVQHADDAPPAAEKPRADGRTRRRVRPTGERSVPVPPDRPVKKPPAGGTDRRHALRIGQGSGLGTDTDTDFVVPPDRPAKKARADDNHRRGVLRGGGSSAAGDETAARPRRDKAKVPRLNLKTEHAGDAGSGGGTAAQFQVRGDVPPAEAKPKRPSRRTGMGKQDSAAVTAAAAAAAAAEKVRDEEARAFRRAWEFETNYSHLVTTMKRAGSLQSMGHPLPLEELFPRRECQKLLEDLFGEKWTQIRESLEDADTVSWALPWVMHCLEDAEDVAVEHAMERRDLARAGERLTQALETVLSSSEPKDH